MPTNYRKTERQNQSARKPTTARNATKYNKTERQNQSARKPTTARNATNYNKSERQNQSARKPTTARSGKGTITNSKGQTSTNRTTLTRQQMLNAVTGSGSPMGHLRQTAEAKNKGMTQRQVTQQAKATLPQTVTKGLEKAHQQQVRQLQEKLDKTTDRRARAAYRQELLEAKYPMSQADRKLPRSQQREIWEAKSLWDRGEQLKKRGQSKAGQILQDYAHQAAELQRYRQGYSGGDGGGDVTLPELTGRDRYLSDEGQKQLRSYKLLYDYAKGTGDRAGMEAARTEAQKLRDTPGAWDPKKTAEAEKTYTYAAALLEQQALYDRSGGRRGQQHKRQTLAWADETMKDLEAAYPDLGRSALSRVGLTLRGAGENTLGSLAEAAGWLLTPSEDGRNYRDRLTGDWADPKPLEQAASEMHSQADKLLGKSSEDLTAAKFGIGKLGDVAVDVGAFGAQMVPEMALGAVTGGVGGLAAMGARAFGGGAHEARQAGASYAQQGLYGLASAGTELVTEKLFSVAAPFRKAFGSGMQVGGKSLDEMLVKALNRVTKNPEAARLIAAASTEGLEEVIADAVNPTIRSIYNGKTPLQNYKEEDVTNWLYDGMIGSILGGLGGVTGQVVNRRAGTGQETLPTEESRTEAELLPRPDRSAAPTPVPTPGEETLRRAAEERVAEQTAPRETAAKTRQTPQAAPQAGRTAAEKLAAYRERYQAGQETAAQDRLAQAGRNLGEHGRKALSAAYEQGTDTADYFGGFSVLYEAGKAGKRAESVQSALVQSLTPAQKLAAYVAGQNDGKLAQPERGRTAGLVRTRAAEQLDPVTARRLDDLGKALDTPIHVREDTGAGVNGWYDRQLGRIVVAAGSEKSTMTVAKHEITHRMQDLAPREYTAYRDYAAKILGGEEGTARLTAAYQERYAKAGVELSQEEALDEAAADFTEAMTEDPALFRRLAEENPGPARTLVEAVKTFLRKIKSVFQGSRHRQDQAAAEAYGVTVRQLEQAAKLWEKALTASSRTAQAQKTTEAKNGNGGKRYSIKQDAKRTEQRLQSVGLQLPSDTTELGSKTSIQERRENVKRYSIDPDFGGKLSAWDRAGRPEGERFTLGSTGPVLQGLGAIESDIYMNGDKIRKILHDHPEMTLREIRRIPEILEDPVLILKSKNVGRGSRQNTRLVIFGSLKAQNGSPVLAVLDLRPREHGFVLNDMQKVSSAYTKDKNPLEFIRSSDVLHVDAKRTIPLLRSIGFQMPIELQQDGSMGSISYKQRSVKIEGEPFSQVVELSGESGERLSLTGENLLEAEARAKALEKENAVLRERVEHFKNQLRQTEVPTVDRAQVRKQARALAKRYQATVTVDELSARLQDLYDRMTQEKHMSWEAAYQEAKTIARDLAESAVTLNDGLYQEYAELRSYLKKTPLRISEEESHDIPDYNSWRKHYLGKVRIGKGKTNVDQVYQELSQMWPELFPQEGTEAAPVAPSDQLLHIAQVAGDLYSVTEENPYSGQMEQITAEIANDVMASFFEVPQAKKTFADKQQAKLEAEIAKGRARTRQAVAAEWEARQREIKKIRDKYWDQRHEDLENRTAAELRGRILRHTQKLSQKLLKPTDKQHIPEEMRFAVAGVLDSINLTSAYVIDPDTGKRKKGDEGDPVKMTEKWLELKHAYETIQAEKAGLDNWVIDPDLMENLNELAGLGNVPIMKMSRKQLVTVWNTLRAVEASILNQDKAFGKARFSSISQAAADLRTENRGKREHRSLRGKLGEVGTDMMTPQAFFHRLGKTGDEIFRMLRNAQDEYITLLDGAQKKTEELLKDHKAKVKQWEKETQTFQLHSGEKLTLTTAQMMSLYELMKRPQAREHILLGGIRPENRAQGLRDTTPAEPVKLDFGDCVQISLKLTEAQRDTADALQQYMAKDLAREGNRASLEVYGYEKFGEAHYFPIRTDRNQVARDNAKEAKAQSISGRGFTKGTLPKANNAVMLDSVFTVYANHVNDMLTYAAWLGPMENLKRLQNYVYRDEDGQRTGTTRAVIERVFGRTGNRYLDQLADDLNQGIPASNSGNVFERLTANYKVASVSANIRVFAQQPSAVLRALDQVSPGDFLLGLARTKPGTWKKVMKYAPIARWKDWGYFDIHTGRQVRNVLLNDDKATDRVKEALMAPAGTMDSLAWSGLWNALEAETRRKHRELDAGSTAFYQAVAARFNEVIDRTQVVDGVLQRSQFMRKPDSLSKMATAFMAEPTKTYNQFMGAVYDLQQAQKPKERVQAMRRMGRSCFALTASIVVNAAVGQAFIDALRDDDDDEDYWEKYRQALTGLEGDEETLGEKLKGIASGDLASDFLPWNYIPFVKDVASILEGYTAKRMDMDSISKFIKAMTNAMKAMQGDGALTRKNAVITLLAEAGRLTGWPVANIKRDIEAIYRTWLNGRGDLDGIYEMNKFLYAMNEKNAGRFFDLAAKAKEQGNDALLDRIEADLRAALPDLSAKEFDKKLEGKEKTKVQESDAYTERKDTLLQPLLEHLNGSEAYGKLSDEQKKYVQETLEGYAKGVATYEASNGEIAPSEAVQKLMAVANAGLDVTDFVTLKALTKDLESVKDPKTGKTIENSKSTLIRKAVEESGIAIPEDKKADVLDLLGVGKEIRNIQDKYFWKYTVPILEKQAGGENYYAEAEKWVEEQDAMTASQRAAGSDDGTYHYGVVGAHVNSNYGWRLHPITHDYRFHHGVDIPAPTGTNIGAARSGTVIEVGSTAARGNYIKVQHDDGLVTLYQHCNSILAQQGDKVAQDQTIATVGSTGKVTGPHLHLEVWKNGKDVDPMQYLGK
jgi:murein DD-endopeptidase MepM/ murein hydrolase activator NlpD|nr:MAG TPA: peptidase [Caudoviricetes sp.]